MTTERPTDEQLEKWRIRLQERAVPLTGAEADEVLWSLAPKLIEEVEGYRREEDSGAGLAPPARLDLPCFVYGLFKPGELAFRRIEPFVASHSHASAVGKLLVRDGLPLLKLDEHGEAVPGALLTFEPRRTADAYQVISRFEPPKHYVWATTTLGSPRVEANLLRGIKPDTAGAEEMDVAWSASVDPVFTTGIAEVKRVVDEVQRESSPWTSLFRMQMAYLLLWSAIERYTALSYGPALGPNKRVKMLAQDDLFKSALAEVVRPDPRNAEASTVFDTRSPSATPYKLTPNDPKSAANYLYQVRSNLSHRGKGAWRDTEKVRLAVVTLLAVFEHMLKHSVFAERTLS